RYAGRTERPVDRYTLATSPEYRFLVKGAGSTPQTLQQRLQQALWYFGGAPAQRGRRFGREDGLSDKLFTPAERSDSAGFAAEDSPWLLVWKTQDVPARTPATLTEVRDQVLRAWRMQEARKLARKKAEEIRDQIAGKKPEE